MTTLVSECSTDTVDVVQELAAVALVVMDSSLKETQSILNWHEHHRRSVLRLQTPMTDCYGSSYWLDHELGLTTTCR